MISELSKNYPKFLQALAHEAATGDVKFGKDTESAANAVFVWHAESPDMSKVMPIPKYVSELAKEIDTGLGKGIQLNFKKNGGGNDLTLRISTH